MTAQVHRLFLKRRLLFSTHTLQVFHSNIYDMSQKVTSGYEIGPVNLKVSVYLKHFSDRLSLERLLTEN